jgi:hypothetical protein
LKIALVVDWPSVDAAAGGVMSEWEWQVTSELMKLAGFKPDLITFAHPAYVQKWGTLFVGGKVGGELLPFAKSCRDKLVEKLQGYDVVLTMGAHAMFCLTGEYKIDTFRGTHVDSPLVEGLQVVPTYAPSLYARIVGVSVANMQSQLEGITIDGDTILVDERLQPKYMTTLNPDTGVPLGFIKAVPLCYTIPGGSVKILSRINNALRTDAFSFNQFNFDTDRIVIETVKDTEETGWLFYPTDRRILPEVRQ